MLPFLDDEDNLIASLEARVGQLSQLIGTLRAQCEQLEADARAARAERELAVGQAQSWKTEVQKLQAEMSTVRTKQAEAASRVRALLEQIDRLGLFDQKES
jgi:outer membrane murein-binding lipoprotein Lpp